MDRLAAMRVFVEVADRGSLTQAAEHLAISRAMVSRYLASLEQWLGARLLHRTTRRISLTDAGQETLPGCRQLLELGAEMEASAHNRRSEAVGRLRIATSLSFAQAQLTAALADFQLQHPRVTVELFVVDRAVDLVDERIDLAVRITNTLDGALVARRLADCRSVLCAAPAYLKRRGTPRTPADLAQHDCITHDVGAGTEYRFLQRGKPVSVVVRGTLSCHETAVRREAALAGMGLALLPSYYVGEDLRRGDLVRLLPDCEPERLGIHAVYLSRSHQPLALRLLIDFLAQRYGGDEAPWDREPTNTRRY